MRRSDREITDKRAIEGFIAKEQILRIAFYDEGDIYLVPVNYGYTHKNDRYSFYFHGAKAGRKYELSLSKPVVGFEIDGEYSLLENETACGYSAAFQSVTGTGTLQMVDTPEEKKAGLNALMKQLTQQPEWSYGDPMLEAVAVYRLDVHKLSCKAKARPGKSRSDRDGGKPECTKGAKKIKAEKLNRMWAISLMIISVLSLILGIAALTGFTIPHMPRMVLAAIQIAAGIVLIVSTVLKFRT